MRDLPRAIAISCTIVVIIYFFTIVSFHTTLSVPEVLGSEAVAVTFSTRLYGSMAWVMSLFVACSTFGGVNGTLLTASRLFMVGAREGQMPALLTCIHVRRATPVPSVIALTLLCLLYLTSSDIIMLMNYVGFSQWLSIGVTVACLPYLRWKHPDLPRPIRVHLVFPIVYLVLTLVITLLPMIASPVETGIGLLMILTSVPVYLILVRWKSKPRWLERISTDSTNWLMRLLVVLPQES